MGAMRWASAVGAQEHGWGSPAMHEHEAELIDYLRVLWRQKWVILITVAAAVAAAWGATRTIAPTYRTETSLLLLPPCRPSSAPKRSAAG